MNEKEKLEALFRQNIRDYMKAEFGPDWTRPDAAAALNVNVSSFSKWDNGRCGSLVPIAAAEAWGGWFEERLFDFLRAVKVYNKRQRRKGAMKNESRRVTRSAGPTNYPAPHPQPARRWRW